MYEPEVNQYGLRHTDIIARVFSVLTGATAVSTDYTTSLCTSTHGPTDTTCLELTPRRAELEYTRIRLYVTPDGTSRGLVRQLSYETTTGNWNTFRFGDIDTAPTFTPGLFDTTPPAGARALPGSES